MTPHLLLLDHSISSICDPWMMGCCETSSYGGPSLQSQVTFLARFCQKFHSSSILAIKWSSLYSHTYCYFQTKRTLSCAVRMLYSAGW
jgi:hypothetical protein